LDFLHHWDGIITISHDIDAAAVPSDLIEPVTTIVTNAVNDAVRHGGAENVGVTFNLSGDCAVLCVTNDGDDFPLSGSGGLGNASLDRLAPGAWERIRREGVTELSVTFLTQF
jgi:signal transduction histidine kinase